MVEYSLPPKQRKESLHVNTLALAFNPVVRTDLESSMI